jgi:hypothetical protein
MENIVTHALYLLEGLGLRPTLDNNTNFATESLTHAVCLPMSHLKSDVWTLIHM